MRTSTARRRLAGALTVTTVTALVAALTVLGAGQAAAVGTPIGFGAGTTGGGNAAPVTVTTSSALISNMQASGPRVIRVSGMIALTGMQDVVSDKTILSVGASSGITGGGLDVDGRPTSSSRT